MVALCSRGRRSSRRGSPRPSAAGMSASFVMVRCVRLQDGSDRDHRARRDRRDHRGHLDRSLAGPHRTRRLPWVEMRPGLVVASLLSVSILATASGSASALSTFRKASSPRGSTTRCSSRTRPATRVRCSSSRSCDPARERTAHVFLDIRRDVQYGGEQGSSGSPSTRVHDQSQVLHRVHVEVRSQHSGALSLGGGRPCSRAGRFSCDSTTRMRTTTAET